MYDIHCHILPNVDDGASDIEEAVLMAKMAKENGIEAIFATPHYIEGAGYNSVDENKLELDKLNTELVKRGIDIKIYLGNEVYSTLNILMLLQEKKISTLNNSSYVLIELPMLEIPMYIDSMLYELQLKGIIPIIAHPERNAKIVEDPNILYKYVSKGVLAQLNLPSLLGAYGRKAKKTAEILVRNDMIHFVGTDAHKPKRGYCKIKECIDRLNSLIGEDKARKLIKENPKKMQ